MGCFNGIRFYNHLYEKMVEIIKERLKEEEEDS